MPWRESRAVNERMKFVVEWSNSDDENFSALCRRYGISRRAGYKWLDRFEAGGPAALEDRPPVARAFKHRTPTDVVDEVLRARKAHPDWGPKKLRSWLLDGKPDLAVPAASSIGDMLKRYGLIPPRKRRVRIPVHGTPLGPCDAPNQLWCVDYKGHFKLGDGSRCHPLTMTDACTRFIIKCEGLVGETEVLARPQFELAFREFGLPDRIRSDNGPPFSARGGLSRLAVWFIQLGITPERIEPGHPEENGRHERMHRTLKDGTAKPPHPTLADQQRAFDLFRAEFNNERPHEALGQKPPGRLYTRALREYPARLQPPSYGEDFVVRGVSGNGCIGWKGSEVPVSSLLGGQPVGIKLYADDEAELFYGPLSLGCLRWQKGEVNLLRGQTQKGREKRVHAQDCVPEEAEAVAAEPVSASHQPDCVQVTAGSVPAVPASVQLPPDCVQQSGTVETQQPESVTR